MNKTTSFFLLFATLLIGSASAADKLDPTRWQAAMNKFKAQDKEAMPKPDGVLFIGSSSIRLWDLEKYFPEKGYINRGFGGSHIPDSTHYMKDIVFPYRPSTIVMYAGGNDLASGKPASQVAGDFEEFVKNVHAELPKTRIVFIAVKAAISRWDNVENMRKTNKQVQDFCEKDERLIFVDVFTPMLDDEGQPKPELLREDKLHLSPAGYELWTSLVKPHLPK